MNKIIIKIIVLVSSLFFASWADSPYVRCECVYDVLSISSGKKFRQEKVTEMYEGYCMRGEDYTNVRGGVFTDTPATLYYKLVSRICKEKE